MANVRLVPHNDHDDATLSLAGGGDALDGFESENTQNTIREKTLRTADATSLVVTGVLPATRTLSHFSMHRHLCHAGTIRLQLYSDAGTTVQVYDSGAVSATSYSASEAYDWSDGSNDRFLRWMPSWLWFAETAAQSYKLTLGGTPSQTYWEISRIWLGRFFEFAWNPNFGARLQIVDELTERARTKGGSLRTNRGETTRVLEFDLHNLRPEQFATFVDIQQEAASAADVVISWFPGAGGKLEALHTLAGRFASLDALGHEANRFTGKVRIEEN